MRVYEGAEIRNVALVGHGHAGKTSLAAGLLFTLGLGRGAVSALFGALAILAALVLLFAPRGPAIHQS